MQLQRDQVENLLDLLSSIATNISRLADDTMVTPASIDQLGAQVRNGLEAVAEAIDRLAATISEQQEQGK
jgi:hypothetical protein